MRVRVLITGAAGNLGSHLAKYLLKDDTYEFKLRLMIHKRRISFDLGNSPGAEICRADLSVPGTLIPACKNIDCIVHFAGVLFAPSPEKFLPITNLKYFQNLVDAALISHVKKIILISFPHVEGSTNPDNPARGSLNGMPVSVHAQTRLQEEKYLFEKCKDTDTIPVSLRTGMIYGKNILMIDACKYLLRKHLLAVWKNPTWIHLISINDFLEAIKSAIIKSGVKGIYHLGDDKPIYLQEFLDIAAKHWGYSKPFRMPVWSIFTAAWLVELYAKLFKTKSPLTGDFIRIGMVSYTGDTKRMKEELVTELKYPTIEKGVMIL